MSRSLIALIAGIAGFFVYIVVALAIADIVLTMHWAVQAIYFVAAGSLWVLPVRWLMYWSVGKR
jgi:hypothetical protein